MLMKKVFKTMAFTLLGLVLSVNLMAANASIELCTSWNATAAYTTAYTHDYTIDNLNGGTATMTLGVNGVFRQSKTDTYFQMNKKDGYFKNTTKLPGKITKIVTTWSAAKGATKCYFATNAEASSSDKTVTMTVATSVTYTPPTDADYYFFNIDPSTGSGSAQMTSCVVYYESAAAPTVAYTVTFNGNGHGTPVSTEIKEASAGAGVTLPEQDGCDGFTFAGWSETNNKTWTTTEPTIISAGAYKPSKNITLYPVYTKVEGETKTGQIASYAMGTGGNQTSNNVSFSGTNTDNGSGSVGFQKSSVGTTLIITLPSGATLTKISFEGGGDWGRGASVSIYAGTSTTSFGSSAIASISSKGGYASINNTAQYFKMTNTTSANAWVATVKLTFTINQTTYYISASDCKKLESIVVKTAPTKVNYATGDYFDPTGLVITATYDDESIEDVTYKDNESKFSFTPNLTTSLTNQTSVTIGYEGKTCTQAIAVSAKPDLSSITLSGTYQTNFIKNEDFNPTGLVVTAHYGESITEDVTSQAEIVSSAYDKTEKGTYPITVNFTDGVTKTTSYDVNVWELSASSNNTALGKVNRSKYVITATPETGVTYANPAYTVDGSADVVQGTGANINKFTVSNVTADTKVTINFVEKVKDIYIDEMHGQLATGNIFYDSYNAPNISYSHTATGDDCQDEHIYFAGWTEYPTQVGSQTAPADIFAADKSMTAGGKTYYAVWAKGEGSADVKYTKITKSADLVDGIYLLSTGSRVYAGQNSSNAYAKSISANAISSSYYNSLPTGAREVQLKWNTGHTAFYLLDDTKYLMITSDNTSLYFKTSAEVTDNKEYAWKIYGGTSYIDFQSVHETGRYLKCNTSSYPGDNRFAAYTQNQDNTSWVSPYLKSGGLTYTDYLTACCTPLVVTGLEVTAQTTNSLTFSWETVTGATGYEYKLSTADNWTTTTETSATISGLEAATEYTIQVRATDNTGTYCAAGTIAEVTEMTYYNTEIYISTPPKKTVYVEGETFDNEKMVVWYTHETTRTSVSSDVTWSPDGPLTTDVTEITVSYKVSDDVTLTTTQAITVKAKWTMLYYINGAEYKKYCAEGDAADVPEVPAVDGFTFVGWVKTAMSSETPIKPTYALAANATKYTPTANNDKLYTVYERKEISVLTGSALSVSTGTSTYYVGGYTSSYYYSETDIENASVFFFDEEGQFYTYVDGKKMYITLAPTGSGVYQNATCPTTTSIDVFENTMDNTIRIACDGSTENRCFGRNNNPTRFGSYKTTSQDYLFDFTKTPKSIEASQSYYNTSAVVPAVDHIEVKTAPTTTTYYEGDKFDATGLVVWAYYSADDEVGKEVPASQYTLQIGSVTDLDDYELKATDENVVITFRNAQCPQSITVNAITLNSITVTTPPNQTKYTPGAAFNPAGMVVYAVYNDTRKNNNVPLKVGDADGYTFSPATLTELGEQDVTISYTDGARGTQTTTTKVTVNSALNEIRVGHNPTKMTYIEGESFDKTGMVVEGSYGDPAEWKEVTGWTYAPTTVLKTKGTLSAAEQVKVTISYTESGTTKTIEDFYVTVNPYPKYTVTFNVNGKTDVIAPITEDTPEGGITIPANPANIGDYTFAGWVTENFDGETTDKPTMVTQTAGQKYNLTENKTFYAVYTQDKDATIYGNIISVKKNDNTYYLAARPSDKKYFDYSQTKSDAISIFIDGNTLFYLSGSTKYYFYNSSQSDLTFTTTKPTSNLWTITTTDGVTTIYNNGTSRYLAFNNRFAAYQNNADFPHDLKLEQSTSSVVLKVPHYTTSPETAKTPVVKFTTSTASTPVLTNAADHTSLATYFNNTLSSENTTGTVVYTLADGDDAVATIAADGTVTAKKAGSVTVTATVGAVAGEWKEASASYTLTFTKIAPTIAFDDNQPTEVYVDNVVTVHATSNSDAEVKYSATSEKISVNATTGEVTGVGTTTSVVKVTATVEATDLYTKTSTTTDIKVKSNAKTQTLTFAKPEGYDFAPNATVDPFVNTLSGAKTTVTYSLKDGSTDGLVTLNATTGEVSVNTTLSGSATVVATAAAGKVTEEEIIWAYGEATAEYMISVNYFRPVLTLTPGLDTQQELWRCTQTVSLTAQEGDKIYYTLNGTDPTTSSTLYNAPFDVDDQMVDANLQVIIKAIAVSNDGLQTSPVLTKTLTKAVPTMTAKVGEEDVTNDDEIELDANDVVTLNATACKIDYRILNHDDTEIEKKVGNATTKITFSKGGTFTLEATPRWSNTNGFKGEKKTWIISVKGAGHLPINFMGGYYDLTNLPYFTTEGTFGSYGEDDYAKTRIKMEGGTLTVSFLEEPTILSYHLMLNGTGDDNNSVVVQESADGHSWTTIVTHCTANDNLLTSNPSKHAGARDPYQFIPQSTTRYIRWTYTKYSGNVGLGSIYIGTNSLIVDDNQDLDPDFSGNVIVENGGKLTVIDYSEIGDLTIEAGGVVDAHTYPDAALIVNNLYLQSADHKSGQFLVDNNDIDIEGNAYFDLTLNAAPRTWYDFAVPFKVNRNSISLANGGAMPEYDIMQYNGATRATNSANKSAWEYVDEGDLNLGTFYMIMFASNVETIRFTKNDGAVLNNAEEVVEVNEYESSNPLDANWNGIANNTLQYVNLGFIEEDNANIKAQVYHPGDKNYTTYKQDEVTFVVGAPFFVQVAKEDFVYWNTTQINDILRAPSNITESVGEFTLELIANGVTYDRLFVSASEDATDSYQVGHDLAKMGVSTTVAQMWINNYNTKLCANEAVLINGQATYQMEVFVPEAGEYKIAITSAPENATLYLTIDGQVAWNLSESAYVANLTKGTHNEFGLLLIANERTTPTNLNGLNGNIKAQKIFKDYNIYILRDAQMYNTQGVKVQ